MKKLIVLLLSLSFLSAFSQEEVGFAYDKKTGIASEGLKPLFAIEKVKGGAVGSNLSIKNTEGQELMYLKFSEYNADSEKTSSNPSGRIIFMEFIFPNTNSTCEVGGAYSVKHYAKMIYDNKLVVNGQLDTLAERRFIKITGTDFSKRRDAGNTIIINQAPNYKGSGATIHIER